MSLLSRSTLFPFELKSGFSANLSFFRTTDLAMLSMFNAKERNWNDWLQLFAEADPGFVLKSANTPPKSELALIVVEWKGQQSRNI